MKWKTLHSANITVYPEDEPTPFSIACFQHDLYIDEKPVATVFQADSLYWKEPDKNRGGRLVSLNGSRLLGGVMLDEKGVHLFKASCDSMYHVTFTDAQKQVLEYDLCLGSRKEDGDLIETMELTLCNSDVNLAYCHIVEGIINNPHIHGTLFDGLEEYQDFAYFDVVLSDDLMSMSGHAWKSEEASFTDPPTMQVQGTYVMDDKERAFQEAYTKTTNHQATFKDTGMIQQLNEATPLYVESLFTLPIPDVDAVNANYSGYLHNLMLYYISDEQIKYIGSPKRPKEGVDISEEMVNYVNANNDVKELLVKHYYEAYLSSLLGAGNDEYSYLIKNIDHYKERLEGYYSGHETTSFCNEAAYQKFSDRLYGMVYFQSIPEIRPYVKEAQNWAEKTHHYALYDEHARLMLDEYTHNIQSRLQHTVILLNYLYPNKCISMATPQNSPLCSGNPQEDVDYKTSLGSDIYYHLINRCIMNKTMKDTIDDMVMDAEQRHQYYDIAAKQLIKQIYAEKTLTPELEDLKAEIEEAIHKKIITLPIDYYSSISAILLEFEATVSGGNDRTWLRCLNEYYGKHPNLRTGIRVGALMLTQGLMIWNSISTFVDWEHMSKAQRASAVMSFSYSVTDIFSNCYEGYGVYVKKKGSIEAASDFSCDSSKGVKGSQALKNKELTVMTDEGGSFWERMMKSSKEMPKVMKFCGGLMSAFAFSVCVCDILSDVAKYGYAGPLTALNVVTGIINGLAMVAIVGFAFISTFFPTIIGSFVIVSLLPGLGWIFTIIGIFSSFITYLVRRFLTKSLQQKYIEKNCVPFVKGLVLPIENQNIVWEFQNRDGRLRLQPAIA